MYVADRICAEKDTNTMKEEQGTVHFLFMMSVRIFFARFPFRTEPLYMRQCYEELSARLVREVGLSSRLRLAGADAEVGRMIGRVAA